jgi:hypothetical protein
MIKRVGIVILAGCFQGCASPHQVTVQADTVTLSLRAPQAARVQFASSADRYTLHEASKDRDGIWTFTGLANREFQYFYLVDGKVFLPDCRFRQSDDFGTANCRYLPWPVPPRKEANR